MARRKPRTTMKQAVAALEQSLGVPLKRTPEGFYEFELPKDHPMAVKAGNTRFVMKVIPGMPPHG